MDYRLMESLRLEKVIEFKHVKHKEWTSQIGAVCCTGRTKGDAKAALLKELWRRLNATPGTVI